MICIQHSTKVEILVTQTRKSCNLTLDIKIYNLTTRQKIAKRHMCNNLDLLNLVPVSTLIHVHLTIIILAMITHNRANLK